MTYGEYLAECDLDGFPSSWRKGQIHFNVLHRVRPDLSEQIRATERDPFYDDTRLEAFLTWVAWMWETTS